MLRSARKLGPQTLYVRRNHFDASHLAKCDANYAPLTPLSGYRRTVSLFPSQPAYAYNERITTWKDASIRIAKYASALSKFGVKRGDVVSIMASNTPPMFESHFAVPGIGAVLHSINTRLDATTIAYQLNHSEAKIVLVDCEFNKLMLDAQEILRKTRGEKMPLFINILDEAVARNSSDAPLIGTTDYESFLKSGDEKFELLPCLDEWDAISLNYTSGTTGNPKGVVCTHRGAYLNAISNMVEWNMQRFAKLLWIVPMFHCNGWMFPWTMTNLAGCSYLMRQVRAHTIFDLVERHKIDHITGAPITMTTLLSYPQRKRFSHLVKMWTAGAPPPPSVIKQFTTELGVEVHTAYGLTETYGPISTHIPNPEWGELSHDERIARSTQQAKDAMMEEVTVMDPETMTEVPADGTTLGEVMIRGNIVMKGYFKNPAATQEAFDKGWFHTGDLAVSHGNGRFEIKDRSKDIIISGGENISSIEVQNILMTHPGVLEVAVVAMPDEKWGEVPCAFVARNPQATAPHAHVTEAELIAWARTKMPVFMAPKRIIFGELAKTSTGKVQKNLLKKLL